MEVTIPDGIECIGEKLFVNSRVKSVTIPKSVKEICSDAFYNCKKLRCVTFAPGSILEKIGSGSFRNTRIERIVIPKGVVEI